MAREIDDLRKLVRQNQQQNREADEPVGMSGRWNAAGTLTASDEPGTLFVRIGATSIEDKRPATKVVNAAVDTDVNIPVILEKRGKVWHVKRLDADRARQLYGAAIGNKATPRRVGDEIRETMPGRNLKPGRIRVWVAGTLKVNAEAFLYIDANGDEKLWQPNSANVLDLLGSVPTADSGNNRHRWVRIALDPNTDPPELVALPGTPQLVTLPLAGDEFVAIVVSGSYIPLDAVILTTGDTTEHDVPESDWAFGRQLFGNNAGGSGIQSIVPGTGINVDNTDPFNPIVSATGGGGGGSAPDIILQDQKAANTAGGGFTSGADQTRVINTEVRDAGGDCTLSSNQFTLAAGTYYLKAVVPAYAVNRHQAFLYNVSDSSVVAVGTAMYAGADTQGTVSQSVITAVFTIASPKAFAIRHRCQTTKNTDGFGVASNFASRTEIYTTVELWKIA